MYHTNFTCYHWVKRVHHITADSQMPAALRRCWSWSRGSSWPAEETTAPLLLCSAFVRAQTEPSSLAPEILDCWGPEAKKRTHVLTYSYLVKLISQAGFLSNTYRWRDLDAKFLHKTVYLMLYIITEINFIYIHLSQQPTQEVRRVGRHRSQKIDKLGC